jgi:uncharacterized protein (TIGR02996 family)
MPTSAAEEAFLPSILARYHDDGPRLIYADFLDESDTPADRGRADLIRTQCALAKLSELHSGRAHLLNLEADLLRQFLPAWTEHLRELAVGFEFRRGLLDTVSVDAATFLARGEELFRRAPIRRLRLLDAGRHVAQLAQCPLLARVRELDLCGNDLGNGGVNVLLRSPHLTRVEELDLSFNGVSDGGVRLIARGGSLPELRALLLTDNGQIGGEGLRELAESPQLAGLRTLDVSGNDVDDAGVRAVVDSRWLTRLHTFRVFANRVGDAGAAALAGSKLLGRVLAKNPTLDLRQNAIGPEGAAALAMSPRLRTAADLDLSANELGDGGLRSLIDSPHLNRLRRLAVRQNRIRDDGAVALADSPLMARLDYLDVSANRLTRRGVDALWKRRRDFHTVLETGGNLVSSGPSDNEPVASAGSTSWVTRPVFGSRGSAR